MFGRKKRMTPREVIANAILQERFRTPVCVRFERGGVQEKVLERVAPQSVAFLLDWRESKKVFSDIHHEYPHHLCLLNGEAVAENEHGDFLKVCKEARVHGCVLGRTSNKFLKQCRKTDRFVFTALETDLSKEALSEKIGGLPGHSNIGGLVDMRHASMFSFLEDHRQFPLFIACQPCDWREYSTMMQAMVTVAPGTRLVGLSAPLLQGDDGWWDGFGTAARNLADTLQWAIANTPAIS